MNAKRLIGPTALIVLLITTSASGVTQLRRGETPPPISLRDANGSAFSLAGQAGRPVVLLFGELYHARTIEACHGVQTLMADPRLTDARGQCVLIVAQQAEPAALRDAAARQGVTMPVLHDDARSVFAAYQVSVLPSVVVVDMKGRVVHAMAGLSAGFVDVTTDAVLYGAGKLTQEQFERTVQPASQPAAGEARRRAERLTELASQLARRGMFALAGEKYAEARAADPSYVPALIGLGRSAVLRKQLADAEEHYRSALTLQPGNSEAELGLAFVQTARGGKELPAAEQRVRAVLTQRPNDPEAHYMLGLIHQKSGRDKEAAASFRIAAEFLLGRGLPEREE